MFTSRKDKVGGREEGGKKGGERFNSQCIVPGVSGSKCGLVTMAVLFDIFSM